MSPMLNPISSNKLQLNEESFVLLFHTHFISLDPGKYYISFSDYRDYRAKVNTEFCQLFHMHPIS